MKTVGDFLEPFRLTGVCPTTDTFFQLTTDSFPGKWKVILYYPKDFSDLYLSEILDYDKFNNKFNDLGAVLMSGSNDSEYSKLAWRRSNIDLRNIGHVQFSDMHRGNHDSQGNYSNFSLVAQLGIFYQPIGHALRCVLIVDPTNCIQYVNIRKDISSDPADTLRVLSEIVKK